MVIPIKNPKMQAYGLSINILKILYSILDEIFRFVKNQVSFWHQFIELQQLKILLDNTLKKNSEPMLSN